ncbi:MAG: PocR ligand-binding domain-containing protein [Proteobacteria bacterium]|nr:PocR ligand-binding domain-containing protein [Pseudomonadota bacterium]
MCVTTDFDYILTLTSCNNMFLQIKIFQLEQNRAILCLRAANARNIQDAFAKGNNVASSLTDTEGLPITLPSNHSKICALIRTTEKGLNNCIYSGKQLGIKARKQQTPIRQRCYSIGFSDAAAPVIVNGRHIANWLIGQYHVDDVEELLTTRQLR